MNPYDDEPHGSRWLTLVFFLAYLGALYLIARIVWAFYGHFHS